MIKYQTKVPFKLTSKFIEVLGEKPVGKRLLIVRDVFTAAYLAIDNTVTFVTDDEEAKGLFERNVIGNGRFGNDDSVVFIDTAEKKMNEAWLEGINRVSTDMKFDIAIMNPPYEKSLHLKILEKVLKFCDKVVNISPIRWLQDPLAKYKKTSDYRRFEKTISKHLDDVGLVKANKANALFDTVFGVDLGIYVCNKGGFNYDSFVDKVTERVTKYIVSHKVKLDINQKNDYRVRIPFICGGKSGGNGERNYTLLNTKYPFGQPLIFKDGLKDGKMWYEFYRKNQYSKLTDDITCSIRFDTEVEASNFLESTSTTFYKYIHHHVISDVHVGDDKILWMQDYSQPWTNKRFCEFFNITGYISDTEAEPNTEWAMILDYVKNN